MTRPVPPALLAASLALRQGGVRAQEGTGSMTDTAAEASMMRRDIHHHFKRLKAIGTLSGSARGNDIHAVVQKYLPAGTRLSRAEALLRQAGFDIEVRQPVPAPGGTSWTIRASSRTIVKSTAFGTSDEVVVELEIDRADADPTVSAITARIYVTSL